MSLSTFTTASGFTLPSIHSAPPFFTQQPNPTTQASATGHWVRLILTFARFRRLFTLGLADIDDPNSPWAEVLKNERINRRLLSSYLSVILQDMVTKNQATFEPPRQSASVLLYWNTPEQWAEILYEWGASTGQLNTILTYYEIMEPPIDSQLSGIPVVLLRKAVVVLNKTGRAQIISIAEGEGVKLLAQSGK